MSQPQPSFFKLTKDIWLAAVHELRPADIKVLFYLLTLQPFNDIWFELEVGTIAEDLNLHSSTVYKSLRRLKRDALIDLEITRVKVKVTQKGRNWPTGENCGREAKEWPTGENCGREAKEWPTGENCGREAKEWPTGENCGREAKVEPEKPHSESVSESLRDIRDIKKRSRYKRERRAREKDFPQPIIPEYRDWLLKRAEQLPTRPTFIEAWVNKQATNPDVIAQYEAWCEGQNVPPPAAAPNFESQKDYWAFVNQRTGQ
jgi:predicted transcriptional regulator